MGRFTGCPPAYNAPSPLLLEGMGVCDPVFEEWARQHNHPLWRRIGLDCGQLYMWYQDPKTRQAFIDFQFRPGRFEETQLDMFAG